MRTNFSGKGSETMMGYLSCPQSVSGRAWIQSRPSGSRSALEPLSQLTRLSSAVSHHRTGWFSAALRLPLHGRGHMVQARKGLRSKAVHFQEALWPWDQAHPTPCSTLLHTSPRLFSSSLPSPVPQKELPPLLPRVPQGLALLHLPFIPSPTSFH